MPDQTPTPNLHTSNIAGAPITSIGGFIIGAGQYLATQGAAWPHDTQGWIQFVIGILLAGLGALAKQPGQ